MEPPSKKAPLSMKISTLIVDFANEEFMLELQHFAVIANITFIASVSSLIVFNGHVLSALFNVIGVYSI